MAICRYQNRRIPSQTLIVKFKSHEKHLNLKERNKLYQATKLQIGIEIKAIKKYKHLEKTLKLGQRVRLSENKLIKDQGF